MSVVWTKWVIILIELVSFGGVLKNILLIFLPLALRDNLYLDSKGIRIILYFLVTAYMCSQYLNGWNFIDFQVCYQGFY